MPDRAIISIFRAEFDTIFKPFKARAIVQTIGVSYGSLLYFTMNTEIFDRKNMIEITLWGDIWELFKSGKKICGSNTITRKFAEGKLLQLMKKTRFENIIIAEDTITLIFTNEFKVIVQHDPLDDYDDLLSLSLPDDKKSIIVLTNEKPPKFKLEYNT